MSRSDAFRRLRDAVAYQLDGFVMDDHAGVHLDCETVCMAHRPLQPWPCPEWTEAATARHVHRQRLGSQSGATLGSTVPAQDARRQGAATVD